MSARRAEWENIGKMFLHLVNGCTINQYTGAEHTRVASAMGIGIPAVPGGALQTWQAVMELGNKCVFEF